MLHHIELYVGDLERSVAFWTPFMALLGYEADRWSGGMNYVRGRDDAYLCLLPAPPEHLAAGYHRKRVGLNHLAFKGESLCAGGCRCRLAQAQRPHAAVCRPPSLRGRAGLLRGVL